MKKKFYRTLKDSYFFLRVRGRNIRVVWYPKIKSEEVLIRELCRAVWYLFPVKDRIRELIFVVDIEFINFDFKKVDVPEYLDSNIKKILIEFFDKISFRATRKHIDKYDMQVFWKGTDKLYYKKINKLYPYVVNTDFLINQFEAIQLVRLSRLFISYKEKQDSKIQLRHFLSFLKKQQKDVLLIGSGPSTVKIDYCDLDFSNTISIVCNSVVKNIDLLKKVNPSIIVASDSVFHSGYSKYAEEFRRSLIKAMKMFTSLVLIVPIKDYNIYKAVLPETVLSRLYCVESKRVKALNMNLIKRTFVKSTNNILTLMMLPIASTISKKIKLIGFDGKTKEDKDIFWKYNQDLQFTSIDSTKLGHPAFYRVDYQRYYEKHCSETEFAIEKILKKGIDVKSFCSSNIPILNKVSDK
ncbi:hypothetical protein EDC55_12029 [Allofrancisella inopinata]|uniref:Uncharacterized protein n=1 Tax=Allofrancisella inopinata TaxID=1085647 RepID=A0AAE6YIG4_9GAMM|nr:hypothetical protein [Allofrancisella inopinata]QIV96493.1 hypothetical protein E4K63_06480 [Allofrancisella inopinata]TDT68514.1 hypothetical protein EDC55_12029 [Allofrancisella inopinata]